MELAEVVLKNNIFTFKWKTLKHKQGTVIGTNFSPPYSILFTAKLEKEILSEIDPVYLFDNKTFTWKRGNGRHWYVRKVPNQGEVDTWITWKQVLAFICMFLSCSIRVRMNPHSLIAWISTNSLLKAGTKSEF